MVPPTTASSAEEEAYGSVEEPHARSTWDSNPKQSKKNIRKNGEGFYFLISRCHNGGAALREGLFLLFERCNHYAVRGGVELCVDLRGRRLNGLQLLVFFGDVSLVQREAKSDAKKEAGDDVKRKSAFLRWCDRLHDNY